MRNLLPFLLAASCTGLAPSQMPPNIRSQYASTPIVSRRVSLKNIALLLALTPIPAVFAAEDEDAKKVLEAAAAKERMAQRIADSKKNYRKPTDLVKDRKDNTDYSCVSTTGSPCPEGLVPRDVQKGIASVLEKFE